MQLWVWPRTRYSFERILAMAEAGFEAGANGWPRPGEKLTTAGLHACMISIATLRRIGVQREDLEALVANPRPRERRASKRLRQLREERAQGSSSRLTDVRYQIAQLADQLESVDLEAQIEQAEPEPLRREVVEHTLEKLFEELSDLELWVEESMRVARRFTSESRQRERIRHLRENHAGMGEAEIAAALRAADKLQRRLDATLEV